MYDRTWTNRLRSLTVAGDHRSALLLYVHCLRSPAPPPDAIVLPSILLSCAALALPRVAAQLHSRARSVGCLADPRVLTALISSYSRLSLLPLSVHLFNELTSFPLLPIPSLLVLHNSLISAYAAHSLNPLPLFISMRRSSIPFDPVTVLALLPSVPLSASQLHALNEKSGGTFNRSVSNCLLSAYSKIGDVDLARQVFDEMPHPKDLIAWNAMISCYAQNGHCGRALDLYREMERSADVKPDPVTLVGVLSACANLGARAIGRDIDMYIRNNSMLCSNIFLKNALISMYSRCGDLTRAREMFDGMLKRSVVTWTAIIAGYGMHGHGEVAVHMFDRMLRDGIRPDGVLMVSVLSACSHAGLTEKGLEYFFGMEKVYGVLPSLDHYACVVDLLGRAGRLKDAWELIRSMPVEPDGAVWGALLGACKIHSNVELGELAFERVIEYEPTNVGYYVLLSNIYSDAGRLDGVMRMRRLMKERGLRKDPGYSYVEHKEKVHLFFADDRSHPQTRSIYEMIGELEGLLNEKSKSKKGEEGSITSIGYHSERLAIAFGLLNTEVGAEIVVFKNLRVCEDCHVFIKSVSRVANRRVVVRDATRFHHFEEGLCSCNDYW
ncbi:hypothetical protein J5N97_023308 [Dioscorea zingiberensis]|uniref:DYW domain-containing protein n=1 Tax=Dioscorea zingiberensis TaxID=325984 RepID=A0A9D5CBT4_9LILI|nr:hypothetical protein J5N97_023308 [Dioscorea zingiberensis]